MGITTRAQAARAGASTAAAPPQTTSKHNSLDVEVLNLTDEHGTQSAATMPLARTAPASKGKGKGRASIETAPTMTAPADAVPTETPAHPGKKVKGGARAPGQWWNEDEEGPRRTSLRASTQATRLNVTMSTGAIIRAQIEKHKAQVPKAPVQKAKKQKEAAQAAPITIAAQQTAGEQTAADQTRRAKTVSDQKAHRPGGPAGPSAAQVNRGKTVKERRQERFDRWDNADRVLQAARCRLTGDGLAALDTAVELLLRAEKATDDLSQSRPNRKARNRLFRVLQTIQNRPQFREAFTTSAVHASAAEAADPSTGEALEATQPDEPISDSSITRDINSITDPEENKEQARSVDGKKRTLSRASTPVEGVGETASTGTADGKKRKLSRGVTSTEDVQHADSSFSAPTVDETTTVPTFSLVEDSQEIGSASSSNELWKSWLSIKSEPGAVLIQHIQQLRQAQEVVWKQHYAAMRRHFVTKGLPSSIWATKMAIQQKGFRNQAESELDVADAKQTADEHPTTSAEGCIADLGGTAIDADMPRDSLWELCSTQLWEYFEGGMSWDQLGWVPGGYLRITTTRYTSGHQIPIGNVVLEFGNRTFTAEEIVLPRCATNQPFSVRFVDRVKGDEYTGSLRFYQGGHLHVVFPALPLVSMDDGCNSTKAVRKMIEFSGIFMGEVD